MNRKPSPQAEEIASRINERIRWHQESIKSLKELRRVLSNGDSEIAGVLSGSMRNPAPIDVRNAQAKSANKTIPEQVFDILDSKFATLNEIAARANLTIPQVKSAIYTGKLRHIVQKKKTNGQVRFRLPKNAPSSWAAQEASASARVQSLLREHPEGLTTAEITSCLSENTQTNAAQGLRATISNAIYTLKQRGTVKQFEGTKRYVLRENDKSR